MERLAERYLELYRTIHLICEPPPRHRARPRLRPAAPYRLAGIRPYDGSMTILIIVLVVIIVVVVAVLRRRRTTGWSDCATRSTPPGRRSTCSSSAASTSSPTWSRPSRATPPTRRRPSKGVTQARANAISAQSQGPAAAAQADNVLTGALKSLFAVAEAYPDLKANQNFLELQEELTATEDKVAYARQFYNDTVRGYNTKIQSIPTNIIAGAFHFEKREYFEADDDSRGPVKVSFS